jgi:RNA polymerase sigma-70 factor (ECF subfamily)
VQKQPVTTSGTSSSNLSKDVAFWSDEGGRVAVALKPLHGAMKVARFLLAIYRKWLSTAVSHLVEINGQPGIINITDGCIQSIHSVHNPEKLKQIREDVIHQSS